MRVSKWRKACPLKDELKHLAAANHTEEINLGESITLFCWSRLFFFQEINARTLHPWPSMRKLSVAQARAGAARACEESKPPESPSAQKPGWSIEFGFLQEKAFLAALPAEF
jgi:hypothetical protein